jgi:hypothetical protein
MNIPIGSVISFTHSHPYNGTKFDLIGEYRENSTFNNSMVVIKVIEGYYGRTVAAQYFPADVLHSAIILYPNVTAFYDENPEYLL